MQTLLLDLCHGARTLLKNPGLTPGFDHSRPDLEKK
jgi:hypothetical protein